MSRVSSVSIVPQAQVEDEVGDDVALQDVQSAMKQRNFGGQQDREEVVFKWQEKVFSQREVDLYSQEANCETVLETRYHQETATMA